MNIPDVLHKKILELEEKNKQLKKLALEILEKYERIQDELMFHYKGCNDTDVENLDKEINNFKKQIEEL